MLSNYCCDRFKTGCIFLTGLLHILIRCPVAKDRITLAVTCMPVQSSDCIDYTLLLRESEPEVSSLLLDGNCLESGCANYNVPRSRRAPPRNKVLTRVERGTHQVFCQKFIKLGEPKNKDKYTQVYTKELVVSEFRQWGA